MAATFAFFHRGLNGASYAVAGLHQGPHGEGAATVFDAEFTAIELKGTSVITRMKSWLMNSRKYSEYIITMGFCVNGIFMQVLLLDHLPRAGSDSLELLLYGWVTTRRLKKGTLPTV